MKHGEPAGTIRGNIRAFLESLALGEDVLEIGTRYESHNQKRWRCNRDLAAGKWLGVDMQAGLGVDMVLDVYDLATVFSDRFTSVVCSEVLEHLEWPREAMRQMFHVIRPGGQIVLTAPFSFPVHAYPDDFFRYTPSGIQSLLVEAGFKVTGIQEAGEYFVYQRSHGVNAVPAKRPLFTHVFATGRKP